MNAVCLAFALLACSVRGSGPGSRADRIVILTRLPTFTPTPVAVTTPLAESTPLIAPDSASATPLPASSEIITTVVPSGDATNSTTVATPPSPVPTESLPTQPADTGAATPTTSPDAGSPGTTPLAAFAATATVAPVPSATSTVVPTATPMPSPTPTSVPKDWAFAAVQAYSSPDEPGLLIYGIVSNNTGRAQELHAIAIAGADDIYAYWPGYTLPPGGRMPFELAVDGLDAADDFELTVEAEPFDAPVQDDFEFSNLNQRLEDDGYCVTGNVRNPGDTLEDYLLIALVLYDAQETVVNFADYEEFDYDRLSAGNTTEFDICVYPPNQNVARYELLAWGE
ncbi:MAG: hypothetical protein R3264_07590 [Anaerolineae bacterium]|nr:hypothetical protein [Anaerolineae bacterium]